MKKNLIHNIICLLKQHQDWREGFFIADHYTLCHKSGFALWSSLMPFVIEIARPEIMRLTFLEKLRLWIPILKCWHHIKMRRGSNNIKEIEEMVEREIQKYENIKTN